MLTIRLVWASGVSTRSGDSSDVHDSRSAAKPSATVAGRSQRLMTGRTRDLLRIPEPGGSNLASCGFSQ